MSLTVACVLQTGGGEYPDAKNTGERPYDASYVRRLRYRVERHLSLDHSFVCLTDAPIAGVAHCYLNHDWPGWWSKLELFRPGLFTGRVLYMDLDTDVVGSLNDIASYDGRFGMLKDWLSPSLGASGVMAWEPCDYVTENIYKPFARNPAGPMASFRGDQNWISGSVEWDDLRALYPGQIVSRWEECTTVVPPDARIVCWHGSPKPKDVGWTPTGGRKQAWRNPTE